MTTEEALILQEAERRGFHLARVIIPSHLRFHSPPKKLVIPRGSELKFSDGLLYFELNGNKSFKDVSGKYTWTALVCSEKGEWAEIIEKAEDNLVGRYIKIIRGDLGGMTKYYKAGDYLMILKNPTDGLVCHEVEHIGVLNLVGNKNRIERGDVELMPIGWTPSLALEGKEEYNPLFVFPIEGVCWQPNSELIQYLRNRPFTSHQDNNYDARKHKGVAWNGTGFYGVIGSSGKPGYDISQLEPFLPSSGPKHVKHYPLEREPFSVRNGYRLPDKWAILIDADNKPTLEAFYRERIDEYINCKEEWGLANGYYFHYPQHHDKAHSTCPITEGYTEITFDEFIRHVPKKIPDHLKENPLTPEECFFPEKWCIRGMFQEVIDYSNKYGVYPPYELKETHYHHYPPIDGQYTTDAKPAEGYTLITLQQFKKHVLTHTVNKNYLNNLKSNEDGKSRSNSEHNNYEKSESCKVQRPNLQIRDTGQIRATGLRCPKVQIQIRSGHLPD